MELFGAWFMSPLFEKFQFWIGSTTTWFNLQSFWTIKIGLLSLVSKIIGGFEMQHSNIYLDFPFFISWQCKSHFTFISFDFKFFCLAYKIFVQFMFGHVISCCRKSGIAQCNLLSVIPLTGGKIISSRASSQAKASENSLRRALINTALVRFIFTFISQATSSLHQIPLCFFFSSVLWLLDFFPLRKRCNFLHLILPGNYK